MSIKHNSLDAMPGVSVAGLSTGGVGQAAIHSPLQAQQMPVRTSTGAAAANAIPGILVLDTCVLLSNVLRRVLLHLAGHGCFIPVWSDRIGSEWCRNASRIWGVPLADIESQWASLQCEHPMANQGDVSHHEKGLHRSDPKDWHVIAAGRAAKSRYPSRTAAIVTRNIRDFNRTELRGYGMTLYEPDDLMLRLLAAHPDLVKELMPQVPELVAPPGQAPASLETILKRERLFRFNRLCRSMF